MTAGLRPLLTLLPCSLAILRCRVSYRHESYVTEKRPTITVHRSARFFDGTDDSETAYWQGLCNGRVSVRLSVRQSVRQSVPSIDRWSQSDEKCCDSQVSVVTFSGRVGKWFTFCFLLR